MIMACKTFRICGGEELNNTENDKMKKIILICIFCLIPCIAFAWTPEEWSQSSNEKTADSLILTGEGFFHQLLITPDGTNDVTVIFYNNTAASGTEFLQTMTFAGDGGTQATPPVWIYVNNGIYIDITTAGTVGYTILFRKK